MPAAVPSAAVKTASAVETAATVEATSTASESAASRSASESANRSASAYSAASSKPSSNNCAASIKPAASNEPTAARKPASESAPAIKARPPPVAAVESMEPRACADKDAAVEPGWAVVAVWRAGVWIISVVAIGADRRDAVVIAVAISRCHSYANSQTHLGLRWRNRHKPE